MNEDSAHAHAIERDLDAIEDALVALGRAAQNDAKHRGTTPLDQSASEEFRSTHSQLAALIKDPVNELCYLGWKPCGCTWRKSQNPMRSARSSSA